jgi:hypothetical protein
MLMLIACSNGAEVQIPPDPTPDTPVLREGEVIGLVQEYLSNVPENDTCNGVFRNVAYTTPVYVGNGVWEVTSGGIPSFSWEVFDQSKIVHTLIGLC